MVYSKSLKFRLYEFLVACNNIVWMLRMDIGGVLNANKTVSIHCNHTHRLMLGEEIVFTARPKINSHFQILRWGRSVFCLPCWPRCQIFWFMPSLVIHSPCNHMQDYCIWQVKWSEIDKLLRKISAPTYLIEDFLNKICKSRSLCFFSLRYWRACFPLLLYPSVCCRPFFLPRSVYLYMYIR